MSHILSYDILTFLVATFAGAVVAGTAGFAFGLVVASLWLHLITPAESTPLVAAYAIVIQSMSLWALRNSIQPRRLVPLLTGSLPGIVVGVTILGWASPAGMRAGVGSILVAFSLYSIIGAGRFSVHTSPAKERAVGVVCGVMAGCMGLGGLPIIIWATICGWQKDQQRAIFQPVTITILVMSLVWMGVSGVLTWNTVRLFFIGLPAVLAGSWIGLKLYGRLDEAMFRRTILALLLISGINLLWPTFSGS